MPQDNAEVVRRWWAGMNEDGLPPLELCHEQIEIRNPADFPLTGPYQGHAGVRVWAAETFDTVDDHSVEVEEIIEAGDGETVFMALVSRGRWKHMDLDAEVPWAAVFVIRERKLVFAQGYLNKADALEAAGVAVG